MMASSQAKISTDGPTKLPGFGLPIDHMPEHTYRFPHAIADDYATQPITFRERRMLNFINQITDKPEWDRKVFDESIVSKWREEAEKKLDNDVILSEPMFDYASLPRLNELLNLFLTLRSASQSFGRRQRSFKSLDSCTFSMLESLWSNQM